MGISVPWEHRAHIERHLGQVRAALSADAFATAWTAGQSLTPDQAIAEVLTMTRDPGRATRAGDQHHGLSRREIEVLRLLAQGRTDPEIAATLFVSRRTAATHVANIYRKLGVSSRAEAAAFAVRHGLA